jgi:hypothetical protein
MTGDGTAGCAWWTAKSVGTAEGSGGRVFGSVGCPACRCDIYQSGGFRRLPRYEGAGGIMISLFCCITWASGHLGPTKTRCGCFDGLVDANDKRMRLPQEKHFDT